MEQGMRIRTVILLWLMLSGVSIMHAQSCLPDGITFSTQSQIDSFQINYPGCTEIEGSVTIWGYSIQNLQGLNVITSIGGTLHIYGCHELESLTGFDNLSSVGKLEILFNNLKSLDGIENLVTIESNLFINGNNSLNNIGGLENIDSIGGYLQISNNTSLSNCDIQSICDYISSPPGELRIYSNATGCDNPAEIANKCEVTISCLPFGSYYFLEQSDVDDFQIDYPGCTAISGSFCIFGENSNINNLDQLDIITSVEEQLYIVFCDSLTSLIGLNNISQIGGTLRIEGNPLLTDLSGLEKLNIVGGDFSLWQNESLNNLVGLDSLNQVLGNFWILDNDELLDLNGLNNLTIIGEKLEIEDNYTLSSLQGLDNLVSLGNGLDIENNFNLINIDALNSLSSMGGALELRDNLSLTSLEGIDNVDSETITSLTIWWNHNLTHCEVNSVCDYLASPNGMIAIGGNALGCATQAVVEEACAVDIEEQLSSTQLTAYPNPFTTSTTIEYELTEPSSVQLSIYNSIGEEIYKAEDRMMAVGRHTFTWSPESLPEGLYFAVLRSEEGVSVVKIIKQ